MRPCPGSSVGSSDVDAFALAASGLTTVTVTPTAFQPDLDVSLTILDAAGGVVTRVNRVAVSSGASVLPSGLEPSATFVAPAAGARYTAVVDGGGDTGGAYADYGSLGPYRIAFTPSGDTSGVVLTSAVASPSAGPGSAGATLAPARAGSYYRASLRLASTRRLRWRIRGARPAGVRIRVVSGRVLRVTGRPRRARTYRFVAIGRGRGATVREVVWLRVTR